MNEEYLKSIIEIVAGIETSNETQSIAKYELIEYVEQLKDRVKELENVIHNLREYMLDIDYKMGWQYVDYLDELLKGENNE